MQVRRLEDPADFLAAATPLLLEEEARHNLMLGVAAMLRDRPSYFQEHGLWLAEEGAAVRGAALRTPPYNLVLARPRDARALQALADGIDDDLPGVVAAQPEVEAFAEAWVARTGATRRTVRAQGLFQLERVEPVAGVHGRLRVGEAADRPQLIKWWQDFTEEALGQDAVADAPDRAVDHRLTAGDAGAGVVLWDDGEPVSFAAYGNPTPNGIRIGPVYTPPAHRRRGYASALVAELSERLLAERRFCFLYTDLANPTANRIYERIGYRRVCEAAEIAFES